MTPILTYTVPEIGLTCLFYATTQRVVLITHGGLQAVSLSWEELAHLLDQEHVRRNHMSTIGGSPRAEASESS